MAKNFLLILVLCCCHGTNAQTPAYIWANNGLSLRKEPSRQSPAIAKILHGDQVEVLDTLQTTLSDTLEKSPHPLIVTGKWLKVTYKGQTGFAFGGYISLLKPQQPDAFFKTVTPIKADATTLKAEKWPIFLEIYKTADGSEYDWIADGDGCWTHIYLFKQLAFNDVLMLINEENMDGECSFGLQKISANTFYFSECTVTSVRNLTILPDGSILYQTEDCD